MKPKLYCVCANLHTSLTTIHRGFLGPRNRNERNDRTKTTAKESEPAGCKLVGSAAERLNQDQIQYWHQEFQFVLLGTQRIVRQRVISKP